MIVQNRYKGRSLEIQYYYGDNEFDKASLKYFLQPALLHIYGREEHFPHIGRLTHTIKERCRYTRNNLLLRRFTILMIRSLIEGITYVMNSFHPRMGFKKQKSCNYSRWQTKARFHSKDDCFWGLCFGMHRRHQQHEGTSHTSNCSKDVK